MLPEPDRPAVVLVHSPLVGPAAWTTVAEQLTGRGWQATVPTLPVNADGSGSYWAAHVAAATGAVYGVGRVAVVGHSGAGPLLALVGSALAGRVSAYVFVDAGLPQPDAAWVDTVEPEFLDHLRQLGDTDGLLPAWHDWFGGEAGLEELIPDAGQRRTFVSQLRPVPWAMLREVRPGVPDWPDAPVGYVRLSESYEGEAAQAAARSWPVRRLPVGHLGPVTQPAAVAGEIETLLAALA